ncbi:MAG: PAS domain-containing protein, partial [Pollutimonas bauzanensis]
MKTNARHQADDTVRHALRAAGVACWDLDLASGLLRRSAGYDEIFGDAKPPSGWRLQEAFAAFLAEDREAVIEAFAQAPRRESIEFEKRIRRASDGAIRWVHLKGRAYSRDGEAAGIAGVVSDVTSGHLSAGKLRQSQQMEAAGQLAREVAHGLNNLLMVIGGNLEMLSERIAASEKTDRLLAALNHGVERGTTLTHSLMAFARPQDLHLEEVCINELISSSRDLLG